MANQRPSGGPANTRPVETLQLSEDTVQPQLGSDKWWHIAFGGMLLVAVIYFGVWTSQHVPSSANYFVLAITVIFGLFMAFNIGGNDVANSFGTSVGAGTLTMKQALIVAAVFEVGGALLAGGSVTKTVRSGIVDLNKIDLMPMDFVYIMIAALMGAAIWLLVATKKGWPVSTTHSIVGGIVGAALCLGFTTHTGGWAMVQWAEIGRIASSWVISPLLGGLAAYLLFSVIKRTVLQYNDRANAGMERIRRARLNHATRHKDLFRGLSEVQQIAYNNEMARDAVTYTRADFTREDLESDYYRELYDLDQEAKRLNVHKALIYGAPPLAAFGAVVITAMLLFKGLSNLDVHVSTVGSLLIMAMIAVLVWSSVYMVAKALRKETVDRSTFILFSWMQVFTASAFAFSHGSNDIANAVGPFAAILDVLSTNQINSEAAVPTALLLACGIALVAGLWFIGRNVITTVGSGLTNIHPASGFAAELAAAAVVMTASLLGLPVSSTHILIGAVLGVGIVNHEANWGLMKPIALAWVITIPVAAGIGAAGLFVLRAVFGA